MDIKVDTPRAEAEGSGSVPFATPSSGPKMSSTAEIRRTLHSAVEELSKHGLKLATKWATEQLIGLPDETSDEAQPAAELRFAELQRQQQQWQGGGANNSWLEGRMAFAKALMDVGEFERASQAFGARDLAPPTRAEGQGGSSDLQSQACFLRWYSLFLAGERRRKEESQLTDALQRRRLVNPNLKTLHAELSACDEERTLDAFGLFIYAAVLKAMREEGRGGQGQLGGGGGGATPLARVSATPRGGIGGDAGGGAFMTPALGGSVSARHHSAGVTPRAVGASASAAVAAATAGGLASLTLSQEVLARSLRLFPYNWSAWLDLAALCLETDTVPEGLEADPPCQWMYQFFLQHLLIEQHRSKDALTILDDLHHSFPGSSYVLAQTAVAHYHLRNFDQGHADFKELRRRDPLRMEGLDTFSNILYVKECKAELSFLAHTTNKSAPLRPETNCIIGNYYSLKGQHEKAVTYFLKALRLDRRCLSAWTLMGHEFVELKNSGAAIESYRQAVDINPKDYRAWYGLGQAYEILQMHLYAIYYYRRATALRPYDARMWTAMGQCLEKLGKRAEAISTYERAMANEDREGIALAQLAKLYSASGRKASAAKCYETMLANRSADGGDNSSAEEGMQFLCHYYKDKGDYARASNMANGLLDYTGTSREEALAVLREIRSIMETRQRQSASVSSSLPARHRSDGSAASPDVGGGGGGNGRPLFTPGAGAGFAQYDHSGTDTPTARGNLFPHPASNGLPNAADAGRGGVTGIGDYSLLDNSVGTPSFMARSPENMSVAMSLGSEDSVADDTGPVGGGSVPGGSGARGASAGAGSSNGQGGQSSSDILSP